MAITYNERWLEDAGAKDSSVIGWYKDGTNEVLKVEKGLTEDAAVALEKATLIISNTVKVGDVVPVNIKLYPFFASSQVISGITFSDPTAATYNSGDKTITFNKVDSELVITVAFTGSATTAVKTVKVIQDATSVTFDNTNSNWVALGTPKTVTLTLNPTTTDETIVSAEFFGTSGVTVAKSGTDFIFTGNQVGKYILIVNTTRNRILVPYYVVAKSADVLTSIAVNNNTFGNLGTRSVIDLTYTDPTAVYKDYDVISSDYSVVWFDFSRGEFVFASEGSASVTVKSLVGNVSTTVEFDVGIPVSGITIDVSDTIINADSVEHTFTYEVLPVDATDKSVLITVTGDIELNVAKTAYFCTTRTTGVGTLKIASVSNPSIFEEIEITIAEAI